MDPELQSLRYRLEDDEDDEEEDMPDDFDPSSQSFVDYNFVADYGFDPLQLSRYDLHLGSARDKVRPLQVVLRDYREAELRHAQALTASKLRARGGTTHAHRSWGRPMHTG